MALVSLENASLAYGHGALLDRVELQLDGGERLALIGRNGSGKSSLLRVLAGLAPLDDGARRIKTGARVAYVPQEPEFAADETVHGAIADGLGAIAERLRAFDALGASLGAKPSPAELEGLQSLQASLEDDDGWRFHARVEQVVTMLGLSGAARIGTLSGGMVKRVALGRALVADPDLLLLDEPTNHLDLDGIAWLEALLLDLEAAVVVVTHDRRFLDSVATRIVELDRGVLRSYPGRFADYQARKAEELAAEANAQTRFDKLLAQEEVWIRKGIEARRTRNEGRVRRLEKLRLDRAARRDRLGTAQLAMNRGELSGRLVAELDRVTLSYACEPAPKIVVRNFSCRIMRGDKLGFIGPNGAGKTSLLKLILGELAPDSGKLRLGSKLSVAYFDQYRAQLDPDAAVAEVVSPGSEFIEIGGRRQHVIGYLGDFLFSPQRARSPVSSLSGGERNRLLLARLFARPANVIVLDEPTNDLDIETLELLEALLADYDGTVLLVSHDRAFLDAVVTQCIAYEGDGLWQEYVGGYDDWQRAKAASTVRAQSPAPAAGVSRSRSSNRSQGDGPRKLTFNESRELEALPDRIDTLESEQRSIGLRLADPALYQRSPQEVPTLQSRLREIESELAAALALWEELANRQQQTEKSK